MNKLLIVCFLLPLAMADMYLLNPSGSNDRNRERNDDRQNGDRCFDSQNNDDGGKQWAGDPTLRGEPDPLTYYTGSHLRIEWTNQHNCGSNGDGETKCETILQYACEDTMPWIRDGYPIGNADTQTDSFAQIQNGNEYFYRQEFADNNQDGTGDLSDNRINNYRNFVNENGGDPETAYFTGYLNGQDSSGGYSIGREYCVYEPIEWFIDNCDLRQRNRGLYTADQNLNEGRGARATRQNPNGNRRGLECPEERDYFPYWHPTPFKDIAVLTTRLEHCAYFQKFSQNVYAVGWCDCDADCRQRAQEFIGQQKIPISQAPCTQAGGTWMEPKTNGVGVPPDCLPHPITRDNHLGNALQVDADGDIQLEEQPNTAYYDWIVPNQIVSNLEDPSRGTLCQLRVRYNISSGDFVGHAVHPNGDMNQAFANSENNCDPDIDDENANEYGPGCRNNLVAGDRPLYNRPYVQLGFEDDIALGLAINTNQVSRTFQDRSFVFRVTKRPEEIPESATIWNLNQRGRRGNIVQTFPSVEYDYVPQILNVDVGDYVHIQFHHSYFNENKNPNNGEGFQAMDATNMVQIGDKTHNIPLPINEVTMFGDIEDPKIKTLARRLALLDQDEPFANPNPNTPNAENFPGCQVYKDDDDGEDNDRENCGKLNNAVPNFAATVKVDPSEGAGTYYYMATRNNNFSNRSHKGVWIVHNPLSTGAIVAIAVGSAVGLGLIAAAWNYSGKHPNSKLGRAFCRRGASTNV